MRQFAFVQVELLDRLPNTMLLAGLSLAVALIVAVPAGIIAAIKRNSWFDHVTNIVTSIGFAVPTFWIGLLLILFFRFGVDLGTTNSAVERHAFGRRRRGTGRSGSAFDFACCYVEHSAGRRLVALRAQSDVGSAGENFVRTARGKGLSERAVISDHAFRNALLPLITLVGLSLPELIAGSAVVETIFLWPGIGELSVTAAANHPTR